MEIKTLPNGLTVIYDKRQTNTVAIEVNVNTGSNNESVNLAGASHFLEHVMFTGTKKRKNAASISKEIDRLGGEFNAFTSHERTAYYIVVANKHFLTALDVLSDMMQNTTLNESFEKERQVILKEISFTNDNPRSYQWILFQQALFENHPAKYPIYGNIDSISKMKKEWMKEYYKQYYIPNNMSVAIVGNVDNYVDKVKDYLTFKPGKLPPQPIINEPEARKSKIATEIRKIEDSYMVFGYKVPPRHHKDSYAIDVIKAILGGGMSSRLFEEIRIKRGLSYSVSAQHDSNNTFGIFAVALNANKNKKELIKDIILKEIKDLKKINENDIEEAKTYLEGSYLIENENNHSRADTLNFWQMVDNARQADNYIAKIRQITKHDIINAADKYLNENYTFAIVEQAN